MKTRLMGSGDAGIISSPPHSNKTLRVRASPSPQRGSNSANWTLTESILHWTATTPSIGILSIFSGYEASPPRCPTLAGTRPTRLGMMGFHIPPFADLKAGAWAPHRIAKKGCTARTLALEGEPQPRKGHPPLPPQKNPASQLKPAQQS